MGARKGRRGERALLDTAGERLPREGDAAGRTLLQRLLWFGVLWLASVAVVATLAYGIRAMIMP